MGLFNRESALVVLASAVEGDGPGVLGEGQDSRGTVSVFELGNQCHLSIRRAFEHILGSFAPKTCRKVHDLAQMNNGRLRKYAPNKSEAKVENA